MLKLISAFLAFSMIGQMPLAAMAEGEGKRITPYIYAPTPLTWKQLSQKEFAEYQPKFKGRAIAPLYTKSQPFQSLSAAPYDRSPSPIPDPQPLRTEWLNHRALIVINFNTPVDAESALSKLDLVFAGQKIPLYLPTEEESAKFGWSKANAEPDTFLVATDAKTSLPDDQKGVLSIRPGIKSKDGLKSSVKDIQWPIASRVHKLEFDRAPDEVFYFEPLNLAFDGQIDFDKADTSMFSVTPPIPNMQIRSTYCGVAIFGDTIPGTVYEVKVKAGLPGIGCVLEKDVTTKFKIKNFEFPHFIDREKKQAIISPDSSGNFIYPIYSRNIHKMNVEVCPASTNAQDNNTNNLYKSSFSVVPDPILQCTKIDLTPFYKKGIKSVRLTARIANNDNLTPGLYQEVQLTDLTLTALDNAGRKLYFVNNRHSGKLLEDTQFKTLDSSELATAGNDTATIQIPEREKFKFQEIRDADISDRSMTVGPALVKPIIQGEESTLAIKFNESGKLPTRESIIWRFRFRPANYSPMGWDDFHFGGDNRQHSLCDERQAYSTQNSINSKLDEDGESLIAYTVSDLHNAEPVVAEIKVTGNSDAVWGKLFCVSDIVHPAALTVGVKPTIQKAQQGYDVKVKSVCCGLNGEVAEAPYTLVLKRKSDGSQLETVEITASADEHNSIFHVPTGEPVVLTAEVKDSEGRLSRTTWHSSVEYCRDHEEPQPRLGLTTDKAYYRPGEKINLWIRSPFNVSEGVIAVGSKDAFKKLPCKLTSKSSFVEIPVTEDMYGPIDLLVKLYANEQHTASNNEFEAPAAEGLISLFGGEKPEELTLDIKKLSGDLKAGEKAAVSVAVKNEKGEPLKNTKVTLLVRPALRAAIESQRPQQGHINEIIEKSLDKLLPKPQKQITEEYERTRQGFLQFTSNCQRFTPPRFLTVQYDAIDQKSQSSAKLTSYTDNDGKANFEWILPTNMPANVVNFDASVEGLEGFGHASINLQGTPNSAATTTGN